MSHHVVIPILLPLCAAGLLLLLTGRSMALQRCVSAASVLGCCAASLTLARDAAHHAPFVYRLGDWPTPFGIVLVSDRLSSTLLVLTGVLGLASLHYASLGADRSSRHFHTLFQFQLAGIHGAFLTGDLFNLFVFFEILLIASYGLLLQGADPDRLHGTLHYVVLNLIGSTLFLVAIGTIYGLTGALNMAHIAVRIRELGADDAALIRSAGLLALVVFGLKAAVVPLHFWLPRAYAATPAAVTALFAIMSKVGIYCIVRFSTLMFGTEAGVGSVLTSSWLLPLAIVTQLVAVLGALGSRDLRRFSSYLLINSIGVMLAGIGLFTHASLTSALLYLVHSTLTVAALFLLVDHVARARGDAGGRLDAGPPIAHGGLLGTAFLVTSVAMSGLPPFSGFVAKVGILLATPLHATGIASWATMLVGSLLALIACVRAGTVIFWQSDASLALAPRVSRVSAAPWLALLGAMALLTVFAGSAMDLSAAAADQLLDPMAYVRSVLTVGGQ